MGRVSIQPQQKKQMLNIETLNASVAEERA